MKITTKKLIIVALITAFAFSIGTPMFAKETKTPIKKVALKKTTKHVVKKIAKKTVAKKSGKKVQTTVVSTQGPFKQGMISNVDYVAKTFTLTVGSDVYSVTMGSKSRVTVPGIKKIVGVENLADDMVVKVSGQFNTDTMTAVASSVSVVPVKTKR